MTHPHAHTPYKLFFLVISGAMFIVPLLILLFHALIGSPPEHPTLSTYRRQQGGPRTRNLLQSYIPDHFGFRDSLVRLNARIQVEWMGVSSSPRVLMGTDGWLFLHDPPELVEEARGQLPLSEEELQRLVASWLHFHHALAQEGIPFVLLVVPDKIRSEAEHLPAWFHPRLQQRRLQQVLEACQRYAPELHILDTASLLAAHRASGQQVFQKTDTHWNDEGAFVAYQALMDFLRAFFPDLHVLQRSDLIAGQEQRSGGDLAGFLGLADRMPESVARLYIPGAEDVRIEEGRQRLHMEGGSGLPEQPRLWIYRDSFSHRLAPYLNQSFAHISYFWPGSAAQPQGLIRLDQLQEADSPPDLVILQMTERWLTIDFDAIAVLSLADAQSVLRSHQRIPLE